MPKTTKKRSHRNEFQVESCDARNAEFIDSKTSRKILQMARDQQNELEEELGLTKNLKLVDQKKSDRLDEEETSNDEFDVLDENEEAADGLYQSLYDDLRINKDDEQGLEMFMSKDNLKRKTLAEYIKDKLDEKESELQTMLVDEGNAQIESPESKIDDLNERVIDLYRGVKIVLSRYRNGKLPKAFKIIPSLSNWEQVLYITQPDCWSAAAMFQATRLFASNLKEKMAQRFYNLILLPRIRDDIEEFKRLNFHLYQALRKALFKPGAFFKGIVLPLCESGDCTLREAVIIGSVMARNHIPLLHACAAMLKISEMDYTGANSIFLQILIQKKYSLPYRVIDALFYHFYRFINDKRSLPVLWHQCLLSFVQNNKSDMSQEQKESLLELLRVQMHHAITPEIRRELMNSINRDGHDFVDDSIEDKQ